MRILVTGGSSCGKSAFAEDLCMELGGSLVYLAAMQPFGAEGERRVRKHRAQRAGKGFRTIECFDGFASTADDPRIQGSTVLLECLGNVVANDLFGKAPNDQVDDARVVDVVEVIAEKSEHLVIVGNEVGSDGVEYPDETRDYQRALGEVSCAIAQSCDAVIECAAGQPRVLRLSESARANGAIACLLENGLGDAR